jgi:hypothetical protein
MLRALSCAVLTLVLCSSSEHPFGRKQDVHHDLVDAASDPEHQMIGSAHEMTQEEKFEAVLLDGMGQEGQEGDWGNDTQKRIAAKELAHEIATSVDETASYAECGKQVLWHDHGLNLTIAGAGTARATVGVPAHFTLSTVVVVGGGGGSGAAPPPAPCRSQDFSFAVRLVGPAIVAADVAPLAGQCAWAVTYTLAEAGAYELEVVAQGWAQGQAGSAVSGEAGEWFTDSVGTYLPGVDQRTEQTCAVVRDVSYEVNVSYGNVSHGGAKAGGEGRAGGEVMLSKGSDRGGGGGLARYDALPAPSAIADPSPSPVTVTVTAAVTPRLLGTATTS